MIDSNLPRPTLEQMNALGYREGHQALLTDWKKASDVLYAVHSDPEWSNRNSGEVQRALETMARLHKTLFDFKEHWIEAAQIIAQQQQPATS